MPFPHVTAPHPPREERKAESPAVKKEEDVELPESYFMDLLQLPSCKISGHCDRCGRCEH